MRVVVVTAPEPVVSTEEAKAHLRVNHPDEDALIEAMVAAATAHIDGPEGWLGRAIGRQTLEARFDAFEPFGQSLPCPPVISIVSVTYIDVNGVEQTLAPTAFDLFDCDITPAWASSWPSVRSQREAVRVRYEAGYTTLPKPLRAAILLMVSDLWSNRGTVSTVTASEIPLSTSVASLLSPYRVYQ